MARFNDLLSLGILKDDPEVRYNKPEDDPTREPVMVNFKMIMIRGIRHFGAVSERMKLDAPIVLTTNPSIMNEIREWKKGDVVLLKGTLASMDAVRRTKCPECGEVEKLSESLVYINPIFVMKMYQGMDAKEAQEFLKSCAEISNRITILGTVFDKPNLYTTRAGQRIVNYKLEAERKYRIKGDYETHRKDYVIVKSYGKIADSDSAALKEGSEVLIEGMLQVRQYQETAVCPKCGKEHTVIRSKTEIIPYSTEYLQIDRPIKTEKTEAAPC